MKARNKLAIWGQFNEVSSHSPVFPKCNRADITLYYGGWGEEKKRKEGKKPQTILRYKYFSQNKRHSSFKTSGQLLQKVKSISLLMAESFTCKNSGDQTSLQTLEMSTGFMWDTTSAWDGHKLHMGHPNTAELEMQKVLSSCCTTYITSQTITRARASSQSSNQKMTGPVYSWKPLGRWVFKSSSSSCHPIVWPVGAPNPQPPHIIISWQKDVMCSHSFLSVSLFKAFWLLVRKWVCLALPFSPSPCCLWGGLVRKCFGCSYTSTASISWGPYGKKGCLPSPADNSFIR